MNEQFENGFLNPKFTIKDDGIDINGTSYKFSDFTEFNMLTAPGLTTPGLIQYSIHGGKPKQLSYKFKDRERMAPAYSHAKDKIDAAHGVEKNYLYKLQAHTGTYLEVYENYIMLSFMESGAYFANVMKGGSSGGKRIDINNITSIQFKEPSAAMVGFMQFEYPGSVGSKSGTIAAMNDENSIPVSANNLQLAREIKEYIENRREELRNAPTKSQASSSAADEILKFKQLLDAGVITQEEFDAKKKQLLGL